MSPEPQTSRCGLCSKVLADRLRECLTPERGEGSLVSCGRDSIKSLLGPSGLGLLFLEGDFPPQLQCQNPR